MVNFSPISFLEPTWTWSIPSKINVVSASRSYALFQCIAEGVGVQVTSYRLRDDGQVLKKLKRSTVQGVVLISPKGKDSGKYKCVAENKAGKIEHVFKIEVERKHSSSIVLFRRMILLLLFLPVKVTFHL